MNKHLVTALLAVLIAAPAGATQSRINSMGGGVKNITVLDDRNIFQLPAELVKWGTWTGLEIGGPGFTSFGIHYNFNPTTVLAIYGSSETKSSTTFNGVSQAQDDVGNGNTHKITAIFGVDLGSARLGVRLGIWGDNQAAFNDGGQADSSTGPLVFDIGLGAGFGIGAADLDLGLDFVYRSPTDVGNQGDVLSNNSEFDIGLLGRLTVPFSGPHELVAFLDVDLAFGSGQVNEDDTPALSGSRYAITAGTDIRLNLADGITVQPGIGVSFGGTTITNTPADGDITSATDSQMAIPFYNVAVDVQVWEWLDIRFGGGQAVLFKSSDTFTEGSLNSGGTAESDVMHKIATGVGFNLPAGVAIDIEVSTGWWQNGPYFITGAGGNFGANAAIHKDW